MKTTLFYFMCICTLTAVAQQDPLSTQFWNNYANINPAMSGLQYDHHATANHRNQWDGVSGAPWTLSGNYGTNLAGHHGVGITYQYHKIGFSSTQEVNLNYNYQFTLGAADKDRTLSVGVGLGLRHYAIRSEWVPPTTFEDPFLGGNFSDIGPNLNAGIAYKDKGLLVGAGGNTSYHYSLQ